jgi:hypothetical protein
MPRCGCCGGEKIKGHANSCQHTSKSCKRCKREAELVLALDEVGCELRSDSKLCRLYMNGKTDKTAAQVARRMAEMKYLHEGYCAELEELEQEIEDMVEELAENAAEDSFDIFSYYGGEPRKRYYRGIYADACREVTGSSSMSEVIEEWASFPDVWPWLQGQGAGGGYGGGGGGGGGYGVGSASSSSSSQPAVGSKRPRGS